jgi:hypothetical protein
VAVDFYVVSNRAGLDTISSTVPFVGIADGSWTWLRSDTSSASSGIQLITGSSGEVRVSNNLKVAAKINAASLPTSSSGLSSGDLWIDTSAGRVIKVVA